VVEAQRGLGFRSDEVKLAREMVLRESGSSGGSQPFFINTQLVQQQGDLSGDGSKIMMLT